MIINGQEATVNHRTRVAVVFGLLMTFVLALTGAIGSPAQAATPPAYASGFSQMNLYLMAHPDDEGSSMGMTEGSSAYKVFMVLTTGERTAFCPGDGHESGEYMPVKGLPQPRDSTDCQDNRRDSFHKFMDDQARYSAAYQLRGKAITTITGAVNETDFVEDEANGPANETAPGDPRSVTFFVGSKNARVMFNLGDDNLTREEVRWAINTVYRNKAALLPKGLVTRDIIGMSYSNTIDRGTGCVIYAHPDHRAVHDGLWDYNLTPSTNTSQYGSTCAKDPDVVLTKSVSTTRWTQIMSKTGTFQYRYGWLAMGRWPSSTDQTNVFHRVSPFWRRHAGVG